MDVIRQTLPQVKKVASIRTICEAIKSPPYQNMLSEVHKLMKLYLTVSITSSTSSERAFSTLWHFLTYIRSTMTEQRLNKFMLLHIHKGLTYSLDLHDIARDFIRTAQILWFLQSPVVHDFFNFVFIMITCFFNRG